MHKDTVKNWKLIKKNKIIIAALFQDCVIFDELFDQRQLYDVFFCFGIFF